MGVYLFRIPCRRLPSLPRQREVKPRIADDTALVCGKVGRRQFFIREPVSVPFFRYSWGNYFVGYLNGMFFIKFKELL